MPPILSLEKISKRFGAIVAADQVDVSLTDGEVLGIIGPNGAGKSTLFGIISGAIAPDSGRIVFSGADITRMSPPRRCRLGLARSFQIPRPFGAMTVFENLVLAAAFGSRRRERECYDACMDILVRLGLADKANRHAGSLGLLDRKRLELARALATRPRVLLLDEVAGGLTERECVGLLELIEQVQRSGVSIIWIEHVLHALTSAIDRLIVLHNGSVIADGDPQAVINNQRVAEIYLGIAADA
jgi:branched-chain amino acid transport system ATP-binding protein